jgi:hypothetical protein
MAKINITVPNVAMVKLAVALGNTPPDGLTNPQLVAWAEKAVEDHYIEDARNRMREVRRREELTGVNATIETEVADIKKATS